MLLLTVTSWQKDNFSGRFTLNSITNLLYKCYEKLKMLWTYDFSKLPKQIQISPNQMVNYDFLKLYFRKVDFKFAIFFF